MPHAPVVYPADTVVYTEEPDREYFLIQSDGKKYRIPTERILYSWQFPLMVYTSKVAISKYPTAYTKVGFRNGTLLTAVSDGKMYIVSGGKPRHIVSPDVLDKLNISEYDFILVSDEELNITKHGDDID